MLTGTVSNQESLAKLACAFAGLVWGVFWIPLRALDAAGVSGAWATAFYYVVPLVLLLPLGVARFRQLRAGGWRLQLTGLIAGASMVLYADAVLHTEVIRAMLLYYLTPVWSCALARVWLNERIGVGRMLTIVLGLFGMLVILGADSGTPWPRNAGDWMGLASGMVWAVAAVLMRGDGKTTAIDYSLVYFAWGTVIAVALTQLPFSAGHPPPLLEHVLATGFWSVPFVALLVVPAVLAMMWGTPLLNPGVVGLLFMTEISVGTVTAAIWAGEPFGMREIVGVVVITAAGLAEVMVAPLGRLRSRRPRSGSTATPRRAGSS